MWKILYENILHYIDIAIFALGYFILPHPVERLESFGQIRKKYKNDLGVVFNSLSVYVVARAVDMLQLHVLSERTMKYSCYCRENTCSLSENNCKAL